MKKLLFFTTAIFSLLLTSCNWIGTDSYFNPSFENYTWLEISENDFVKKWNKYDFSTSVKTSAIFYETIDNAGTKCYNNCQITEGNSGYMIKYGPFNSITLSLNNPVYDKNSHFFKDLNNQNLLKIYTKQENSGTVLQIFQNGWLVQYKIENNTGTMNDVIIY